MTCWIVSLPDPECLSVLGEILYQLFNDTSDRVRVHFSVERNVKSNDG